MLSKCQPQVCALFLRAATGSWTTARRMAQTKQKCLFGCTEGLDEVEHYFSPKGKRVVWSSLAAVIGLPDVRGAAAHLGLFLGKVSCLILPVATIAYQVVAGGHITEVKDCDIDAAGSPCRG